MPVTNGIDTLRRDMSGDVLEPGDSGYDEARSVWNAMIDKHPALIAQCTNVADVVAAVGFARQQGLLLAVKGGGHNVAGNGTCAGGIVIDLSPMRSVTVDTDSRTARAEGGVTWGDYDAETQRFGLGSTGGAISTTGLAGLTLGGGFGWLGREFGLACDCLVSAEMVTADGRIVTASAHENSDLFWGLRGGGGNFGVVTSFEFRLHDVGELLAGLILHPRSEARAFFEVWARLTESAPDQLGSMAALLNSPDGDPLSAVFVAYHGDISEGERILEPLRSFGSPLLDGVAATPYIQVQQAFDEGFPAGNRDYWKSHFHNTVTPDLIDALVEQAALAPSPLSVVAVEHLFGGAIGRVAADATAFGARTAEYNLIFNAIWQDSAADEANIAWARNAFAATERFSTGEVYVNYMNHEEADRMSEAYSDAHYQRLVDLKRKYDPDNLFRRNQNIDPA